MDRRKFIGALGILAAGAYVPERVYSFMPQKRKWRVMLGDRAAVPVAMCELQEFSSGLLSAVHKSFASGFDDSDLYAKFDRSHPGESWKDHDLELCGHFCEYGLPMDLSMALIAEHGIRYLEFRTRNPLLRRVYDIETEKQLRLDPYAPSFSPSRQRAWDAMCSGWA